MKTTNYKSQTTRTVHGGGYTLLFAVLTAALVLGVAVFILSVSKKQYALSVAARDSMYALYAADSAMECAAATSIATGTPLKIRCGGGDYPPPPAPGVSFSSVSPNCPIDTVTTWPSASGMYQVCNLVVLLDNGADGGSCALVTVTDGYYVDNGSTKHKMIIDSRGYNYCDSSGPKASSRTVERALRLTYR